MPGPARRLLRTQIVVVALLVLPGCTLVGGAVGKAIDRSREPHRTPVGLAEVFATSSGSAVEAELADGSRVAGLFVALEPCPLPDYRRRYEETRASDPSLLPELGEGATVRLHGSDLVQPVTVVGFDPGLVRVLWPGSERLGRVAFGRIAALTDRSGNTLNGGALQDLAAGRLPFLSRLVVDVPRTGRRWLPLDEVREVTRVERPRTASAYGVAFGAVLDGCALLTLGVLSSGDVFRPD